MTSDLDMSEYPVTRQSQTEDTFLGAFCIFKLCVADETIRNQEPGREARVNGEKSKTTYPAEC